MSGSRLRGDLIFEASPDPIALRDLESDVHLDANRAFSALTGLPRESIVGRTPAELGLWDEPVEYARMLEELRREGSAPNRELTLRTKSGALHSALVSAACIDLDGRPAVLCFLRDVTERRRMEEDLRAALARAQGSDRLKSAFLANISHEIRTPLNVILGYNHLIGERLSELGDSSLEGLFAAVERAGKRLTHTIHEVLDLSKIEVGAFDVRPAEVRPGVVLSRLVPGFELLARQKGLSFSTVVEDENAAVTFDEYCLEQAVTNLAENAIKFTERGGVTMRLRRDAEGLRIEVSDTGVGIDHRYLPRLFQPFSQEESGYRRRFEGTGIGLALTRRYLELNGARLSVRSGKGQGSTFVIHLGTSAVSRRAAGDGARKHS